MKKSNLNLASQSQRVINLIIDTITFLILWFVLTFILMFFNQFIEVDTSYIDSDGTEGDWIGLAILLPTYWFYYIFMEYKFQKTIGKFVTKTKVVHKVENGLRLKTIIIRTICRNIPFEYLSFFKLEYGVHDLLSNTTVEKC